MFIEHNAHLNTSSGIGWTALHYASQANKPDCVALLIAAGARVDMKNAKGKTVSATPIAQQPASAAEGHSFTAFAERACFLRRMIPSSRSLRSLAQQPASATEGHSFTARACFRRRMIPSSRSLRSLARSLSSPLPPQKDTPSLRSLRSRPLQPSRLPASAADDQRQQRQRFVIFALAPPPARYPARFCRKRAAAPSFRQRCCHQRSHLRRALPPNSSFVAPLPRLRCAPSSRGSRTSWTCSR
jgi:hypothetical protein